MPNLTLLERREIEAAIVGPLVRAFASRFGQEPVRETLAEVIRTLARQRGESLACELGSSDLETFATTIRTWTEDDALELEWLESSPHSLSFNVKRCRYAEMYRHLGLEDLGATLSCLRDFELASGFNENIELKRTQTLMEGATHCDFRFSAKPSEVDEPQAQHEKHNEDPAAQA